MSPTIKVAMMGSAIIWAMRMKEKQHNYTHAAIQVGYTKHIKLF